MKLRSLFGLIAITVVFFSCQTTEISKNHLLLKNGTVVDAELGTMQQADVLISDGKIAKIGANLANQNAKIIDCSGKIVTAGFIDSHVHAESSMVLPAEFGKAILPHGTTAIIADPHEVVNVGGAAALRQFIEMTKQSPVDMFIAVPSSVPATKYDTNGAGKFLAKDMEEFIAMDEVVSLGEVMCYVDVFEGNPEILDKIALFQKYGKTIDGHTSGMPATMLDKYVAAGVQNDHECADVERMMSRYEKGINIYAREGSAARNAQLLLQYAKDNSLNINQFALCTDDKHLATIAKEGHISYIVRMARKMGFSWPEVAKMASYNPCKFYKLANRGNIKKGYLADIVVTDDNAEKIDFVIKNGKLVAQNQQLISPAKSNTNQTFANTVVFKNLTENDFVLPENLKNVAIELVDGQILTNKLELNGDEWKSLNRLATIERYGKNGNIAVCALKGYGISNGAIATSVSHDSHNVICAGDNEADMALACNHLKTLGGGYVIASQGKIVGELPLPAFGLMSNKSVAETTEIIEQISQISHQMGVNPNIDVFITLSFVALPVIPTLRLLDTGLFDCTTNTFVN